MEATAVTGRRALISGIHLVMLAIAGVLGREVGHQEVLPDGHRLVRFIGASAEDAISRFGRLPLPPYITRDPTPRDEDRYQTVYARDEGRAAFHTSAARRALRQGGSDLRARPPGRTRHFQAGGGGRPE